MVLGPSCRRARASSHHGAHRRWLLACLVLGTIGSAARASASNEPCATPAVTSDGWQVATPGAAGFDANALCATLSAVARGAANLHGVIVERHGRLVAELYRAGRDAPIDEHYGLGNPFAADVTFDADTLHDTRSVSKSVVGLLVGIAQHDDRIPSLGTSVLSLFPELADLRTPERDAITLEQLSSMSSGLAWDEWNAGPLTSDETRLFWKSDLVRFVFDRPLAAKPGTHFNYNGGGTATLAELLTRGGGKPLLEQVREELFEPLGITRWEWALDLRGRPLAFAGLRMRPRDMAKLGRLVLDGGRWRGRQLVPEAWVAAALRKQIATELRMPPDVEGGLGYGYQWWTGNVAWRGRQLTWSAALGNGGQRIFIVPELDLTVVTTAGDYGHREIGRVVGDLFARIVATVAE
jgi:CubicO group peptidase (beta-lactamase class C family)